MTKFHLYLDDSGSRYPDNQLAAPRADGMDHFALGGILAKENEIEIIVNDHRAFCGRWSINYPLHSSDIRGSRKNFSWLALDPVRTEEFFSDLQSFIVGLPIICIAAVVHRPGYVARYQHRYAAQTWMMCKTAFAIVVERAAKYVDERGAQLEIYFEQAGKREDRAIKAYGRSLKLDGMPFDTTNSASYGAFTGADFRRVVLGEPRERKKTTPMMQVADLVLYPIAKAGYDPTYSPYRALVEATRLIDTLFDEADRPIRGSKYSCFDGLTRQDPA